MVKQELIIDLIGLVQKHGVKPFIELSEEIRKPDFLENISLILRNISKVGKDTKPKKASSKKIVNFYPKNLNVLKETDVEKFDFLNQLYDKLRFKQVLPSLRDINFFREDNGLVLSKAKSHKEAVKALINDLSSIPLDKLKDLEPTATSEKEGLQGWSDIILKKHKID